MDTVDLSEVPIGTKVLVMFEDFSFMVIKVELSASVLGCFIQPLPPFVCFVLDHTGMVRMVDGKTPAKIIQLHNT
jgi:hypothetical protein